VKKAGLWVVLFLSIRLLAGCSKDEVINEYNEVLQEVGKICLTPDRKLEGERSFGEDSYVGRYQADYKKFSGEEIVFGNTALNRKEGNEIAVTCEIDEQEGSISLLWKAGADVPKVLLEGAGSCSEKITLPGAGGYLVIQGEDFAGHLELTVETQK